MSRVSTHGGELTINNGRKRRGVTASGVVGTSETSGVLVTVGVEFGNVGSTDGVLIGVTELIALGVGNTTVGMGTPIVTVGETKAVAVRLGETGAVAVLITEGVWVGVADTKNVAVGRAVCFWGGIAAGLFCARGSTLSVKIVLVVELASLTMSVTVVTPV